MNLRRGRSRPSNLPNALRAAARAILDEAGPDVVMLRETARRVGVSATAAYRHFADKEDLLASVAAEGFRELAAAMETGATESDPLRAVGLAYVEFALQKRGLFRLMFGPVLVQRAKYPELDEAARAVFGLLQRVAVSADEHSREDNSAGMAAWGLVHGLSSLFIDGLFPETYARGMANTILVQRPRQAVIELGDRAAVRLDPVEFGSLARLWRAKARESAHRAFQQAWRVRDWSWTNS